MFHIGLKKIAREDLNSLEKLDKDPIWNAAMMPEDYNRDFRHSADSLVGIMEASSKKNHLTRKQAAKKFSTVFKKWFKTNKEQYENALHKVDKTPMSLDFEDHAMRALL
jgi:hypothetical protein